MVPNQTLQERVQQRKEKANPPQTTTKEYRFKHTNNKKNKTCENCDPMNLEWSNNKYSTTHTTTEGAVATERGRESEYTYWHTYLSPPPYSIWTRPELNADAPRNTAREGATKKRKTNPPQTTTKEYRFKHTKQK